MPTTPCVEPDTITAQAPPVAVVRRLTRRWQFLACAKGRSLARGAVAVQVLHRADGEPAIGVGFTATRKVGGAVVRNRAKRRLREAARRLVPLHGSPSHDYVFVARAGAPKRDWLKLLADVESALTGLAAGGDDFKTPRSPNPRSARPPNRSPSTPSA